MSSLINSERQSTSAPDKTIFIEGSKDSKSVIRWVVNLAFPHQGLEKPRFFHTKNREPIYVDLFNLFSECRFKKCIGIFWSLLISGQN